MTRSRFLYLLASLAGLALVPAAALAASTAPSVRMTYEKLSLPRSEYVRLQCHASNPHAIYRMAPECNAEPALTNSELLSLLEETCKPKECPKIDRGAPAIVWIGLVDDSRPLLVAPRRSGIPFDTTGTRLPRADRLTAVSITDYSESTDNSVELTVSERGQGVRKDTYTETQKGFPDKGAVELLVTITITSFEIPYTPSALSVDFKETDAATLTSRSGHASYQAPPYYPLDFDVGFLVPFQAIQIDRLSLRRLTPETCDRVGRTGTCQQVHFEEAKRNFYLVGTLNMTGIRNKALEGEFGGLRWLAKNPAGRTAIRAMWPDAVFGIGMPTVKHKFLEDNSLFVGVGWRLRTDRVRLTWGYQFTTLETLRAPYIVDEFVANRFTEADLVERRRFRSSFVGISISVVSFPLIGRNSH